MRKQTPKRQTRRSSKTKFSKIIIASMLAAVAVFTAAMIYLYARYGGVPDTLIISFFGFCGGEAGFMGLIKCNDAKYEKEGKAADGSDDVAVG